MEKTTEWRPGAPLPTVCRCCLADGCYKDISTEYFWMGSREVYSEMLSSTFDIQISYSQAGGPNSHSRLICEACITRLRDAYDFKKQVLECEKTFMQHLDPGRLENTAEIELELISPIEKAEEVKVEEVKQESNDDDFDDIHDFPAADDDDDDDLDDEPLTKLASRMPKKESMDILDLIDNKVASTSKRKATIKLKTSPSKKSKTKEKGKVKLKDSTKSKSKSATKDIVKAEKKKKDDYQDYQEDTETVWELDIETDPTKVNAAIILQQSTAYPFQQTGKSYRCCFCRQVFDDPSLFRSHVDQYHSEVDKALALKLRPKIRLDITNLKCKHCIKVFSSLESLAKHLNDEHDFHIDVAHGFDLVPFKLEKDRFVCAICNSKFNGIHQLSRHTSSHFVRCICELCGKNFESRFGIADHIKKQHTNDMYWCRNCKSYFPTLQERKNHILENKRCQPYRCYICKERFIDWESKEEHLVSFHGKPKRVFKCTECDQQFDVRRLLYVHFQQVHIDEFKCKFCELKFTNRNDLREHSFEHSDKCPIKCSICHKPFLRDSVLKRHLRTHDDSKKHACAACSRLFVEKAKLKEHVKKYHPEIYDREFGGDKPKNARKGNNPRKRKREKKKIADVKKTSIRKPEIIPFLPN